MLDRRGIARALSAVENRIPGYQDLLAQAYRIARRAVAIGVTGPPGAGKSTLVDALTAHWAAGGSTVAVLAVDPSSPYSGGAVLGDRIRRTRSAGFENTYFRSLSSRGHLGGLNASATDLVAVLGLHGFERVIIETVGAGQSDVEIHETADCTVVMAVPGLGDFVQASKAGLMEIGDVFAVNKADLPGAEDAALDIERALSAVYSGGAGVNVRRAGSAAPARPLTPGLAALQRRHGSEGEASSWVPPVLRVVASENRRVAELATRVDEFLAWSEGTGRRERRASERVYAQLVRALSARLLEPYVGAGGPQAPAAPLAPWIQRIMAGAASPIEAAQAIIDHNEKEAAT